MTDQDPIEFLEAYAKRLRAAMLNGGCTKNYRRPADPNSLRQRVLAFLETADRYYTTKEIADILGTTHKSVGQNITSFAALGTPVYRRKRLPKPEKGPALNEYAIRPDLP